ncbi:thiol-disulfide oxidoreductase DCC family protein [Solibacillus sp. FSL R7-0668]|uniref:thiol-disulfide oxidoreductase DCC family protein n=1 Tax=Solibacillus sp. FSL R7-0668 TaxID=2921688 RepID=UPI0030FA2556
MRRIVLFDGECHFCDASVQFILARDQKATFQFAALQSEVGQALLKELSVPNDVNSLVLIEGSHYHTKSTAALKIAKQLDGLWKLLYGVMITPRPIRDTVYRYIAKNRYKWFGKKEVCQLPSVEQRERFL